MARSALLLSIAIQLACCAPATPGNSVLLDDLNEPRGLWLREDGTLCGQTAVPDVFDEINVVTNSFSMIADLQNGSFIITYGATGAVYSVAPEEEIRAYSQAEGHAVLAGIG